MAGKEVVLRVMGADGVPRDLNAQTSEDGLARLGVKDTDTLAKLDALIQLVEETQAEQLAAIDALTRTVGRDEGIRQAKNISGVTADPVNPGPDLVLVVQKILDQAMNFRGFIGSGETDGKFICKIGNTERYFGRIHIAEPTVERILPTGEEIPAGTTVSLWVVNQGLEADKFEGVLLFDL